LISKGILRSCLQIWIDCGLNPDRLFCIRFRLNLDAIHRATDELQKASHAMAEQLYKQSEANAAHAGASAKTDDDVKEGEVVDA